MLKRVSLVYLTLASGNCRLLSRLLQGRDIDSALGVLSKIQKQIGTPKDILRLVFLLKDTGELNDIVHAHSEFVCGITKKLVAKSIFATGAIHTRGEAFKIEAH